MQFQEKKEVFDSPYDQYRHKNGEEFEILQEITIPDQDHDGEVLPMYKIRFKDGSDIEAWPEEIFNDCLISIGL